MKHIRIIFLILIVIASCFACTAKNSTEPKTVHVSSDWKSDYSSLEEAVEAVAPTSTIVLDTEQYELTAPLVISKSLTIKGAGVEKTMITSSIGGAILAFEGDGQWMLSDLTVERTAQFASDIMYVTGGKMTLENCKLASGASSEDESIPGSGLVLQDNAQVSITDCSFVDNDGAGIIAVDTVSATIKQVLCSENGAGILFGDETTGLLQDSTCADNQGAAIYLYEDARIDLLDNRFTNNGGPGIFIRQDSSNGKIQGNRLSKNALALEGIDMQIYGSFMPEISGNFCSNESNGDSRLFGGDLDGIVFYMFGHEDPQISIPTNRCTKAICTGGSVFSMSCETSK